MSTPSALPAPIIYINAFPGAGKLSIANQLRPLIPNSRILHNNELIDPVEQIYPRNHAAYAETRTAYRRHRLQTVAQDIQMTYIFTDAQTEYNNCVRDYHALSLQPMSRRFYSIVLECDIEENVRRLTCAGRGGCENGKLTDAGVLRGIRAGGVEIWRFGGMDEFVLDVSAISAEEVADRIAGFVRAREAKGDGMGVGGIVSDMT